MTEKMIRIQILKAAEARFTQYGYGKTTMAEIARDCDMTAGNLYRYFENKLDIGAGIASFYFDEEYKALEKIVNQTDVAAEQKLEAFVLHALHHCHTYFTNFPRVVELVEVMSHQKPCVCDAHQQQKIELLVSLLTQAQASKEFEVGDVAVTAMAIHAAMLTYHYPPMMANYTLEELENSARTVCKLLTTGLRKR